MNKKYFTGKSFCFTGKMAELKRTQAEKEVRARDGLTQNAVNKNLDYLVVGSIPSNGWKHKSYGNKIEKAMELKKLGKLKIISENAFMLELEECMATCAGDIDEKIIVCRYKCLAVYDELDIAALQTYLEDLNLISDTHVVATLEEPYVYQDLYDQYEDEDIEGLILFQCRIIKQVSLDADSQEFVDHVSNGFENIRGLDGSMAWSEKKEGSASFAKLFKEISKKVVLI